MSLEIKKGSSPGVNDFLLKRASLIKHLVLHEGSIDPQLAQNVAGKLTNLQSVTVDGGVQDREVITDDDMVALQRMCPSKSLAKLSLSRLNSVSVTVVDSFISNFNSLTHLTLNYCPNFNDVSLSNLAASCGNLRVISLRSTMIGDNGLSDLATYCSSLISADFGECRQITDIGVESIARQNKYLEEINVDRCPGVTETALVALAKDCHNLTVCNMENCTGIRKLPSALVCCRKLQKLNLSGCKQLTYPCGADSEVVQQSYTPKGFQQLLTYFLDYQLTYRIKVFVIGDSGVGKSALIKCLTFDNPLLVPQGNAEFCGVSLWDPSSIMPSTPGANIGKFVFEIWELPSQVVGLGDVFYIEPAIYLVCYDLVEGGVDSVIRNVLSILTKYPNANVLVVGTRADALNKDDVIASLKNVEEKLGHLLGLRTVVAKKYSAEMVETYGSENMPPICQRQIGTLNSLVAGSESKNFVHAVSCRSRSGISELRQSLLRRCADHSSSFPQLLHTLTPALVQLYEDIRQLRLRSIIVLPWAEFAYFAERAGIPQQDVERETAFFHNTGVIFDFRCLSSSPSDSYICIDPARFLELFSSIHSPNMPLPDDNMSTIVDRGQFLGRMLPSVWKLSDTDQLELLEALGRQLGLICQNTAALPPACFDKALPPLPLGAHRCAFIRRVYSLPLFYSRLPNLSRPIHWQPELAVDDCQLSLGFHLPAEVVSILKPSFERFLAAIPSLFSSRGRSDLMLIDFDLSKDLMLLRFNVDNVSDDFIEILISVSLSTNGDGISVSARVNKTDFSSNLSKVSQALWFYCTSVAHCVYSRLLSQLNGVPLSIVVTCKRCPDESVDFSLWEMLSAWQKDANHERPELNYPPVSYPSSDFESLGDMFSYIVAKLRKDMVFAGLQVSSKSPAFHQPSPPRQVCGDGIIVNDGCFRRGKSKKLPVQFLDDFRTGRSISIDSAGAYHPQQFWSPTLSYKFWQHDSPGSMSNRTLPMNWRPEPPLLQSSFSQVRAVGNHRMMSVPYDGGNSLGTIPAEESSDEKMTRSTITGDCTDYTDHLSMMSSNNTATHVGSLPSLDSNSRQQRQMAYKRRRLPSPPPPRPPVTSPTEPDAHLAKEEEENDSVKDLMVFQTSENVETCPQSGESLGAMSDSTASLEPAVPISQTPLQNKSKSPIRPPSVVQTETPLHESRPNETKSSSPEGSSNANNKTETLRSSGESTRSTPSVGGDSGLVGFEDVDSESDKRQLLPSAVTNDSDLQVTGKIADLSVERPVPAVSPVEDSSCKPVDKSATLDSKSPSSQKRNKIKMPSFRKRNKSDDFGDAKDVSKSPTAKEEEISNSPPKQIPDRRRARSFRIQKDKSKCLCS